MSQDDNADVLRIMISTDNHLGVWERDEWRCNDSFEAFEEVFKKAKEARVDMVLLGGDLFHDNKPSRNTLIKCLDILNRYCLNDDPIGFEVVSDPANVESGVHNTQSETLNVGLPVFTIHGNHDDPAGPENLSAMDILSTVQYVNYFGKHMFAKESGGDTGRILLKPLLLKKGDTKLALYGLGFLREERLARSFQTPGQVEWTRPAEDKDDWFNVFVLHQNRVQHHKTGPNQKARNVQDRFLPSYLDVVIWGHEHECKPAAIPTAEMDKAFSVLQPGSTVATSLSEPESQPKSCFILDICGDQWRITNMPLTSVRPFKWKTVSLKELGAEIGNHKQIEKLLTDVVEGLIQETLTEQAKTASEDPHGHLEDKPRKPKLPLIRLRVDYTGYSTIHSQRFGQMFVNRVANPTDIILWSKTSERKPREPGTDKDPAKFVPEALDEARIEDLISDFAGQLEILPASELGEALTRFVDKDEKNSLQQTFEKALKDTQAAALLDLTPLNEEVSAHGARESADQEGIKIVDTVHAAGQRLQAQAAARTADTNARLRAVEAAAAAGELEQSGDEMNATPNESDDGAGPSSRRRTKPTSRPPVDDDDEGQAPPAKRGRKASGSTAPSTTRGRGRGRGRATTKAPAAGRANLDAFLSQSQQPAPGARRASSRATGTRKKGTLAEAGLDSSDEDKADDDMEKGDDDSVEDLIHDDDNDDDMSIVQPSNGEWTQQPRAAKPSKPVTARQATAAKRKGKKDLSALWGAK